MREILKAIQEGVYEDEEVQKYYAMVLDQAGLDEIVPFEATEDDIDTKLDDIRRGRLVMVVPFTEEALLDIKRAIDDVLAKKESKMKEDYQASPANVTNKGNNPGMTDKGGKAIRISDFPLKIKTKGSKMQADQGDGNPQIHTVKQESILLNGAGTEEEHEPVKAPASCNKEE